MSSSLDRGGSNEAPMANVDDPAWVMARYEEAKEILNEIRDDVRFGHASIASDHEERIEDFWATTFMDRCTTMGLDCGCNRKEPWHCEGCGGTTGRYDNGDACETCVMKSFAEAG